VLSEIARFIRRHLWHLLLLIPGALAVTATHEAAHAVVVILQGGTVREFHWVPSVKGWGYVTYQFPARAEYSRAAVSLAPYAGWFLLAALTTVVAVRWPPRSYFAASCWFVWGFLIPLADIANAAFFWLQGMDNDFRDAFGPPAWAGLFAIGGLAGLCIAWGAVVERGLHRDQRLSCPAYLVLSGATVVGLLAASVGLHGLLS
jgi:hypothetical protein